MRFTAVAVIGVALLAVPAVADDMIYHAKSGQPDILTTFDGQAYWKPLARCVGIYTSLAKHLRDNGKNDTADTLDQERQTFMSAYAQRIARDRGVSVADALAVGREFSIDSAMMMDKAIDEDAQGAAGLLTQCETAFNIIIQETGMN